MPSMPEEYCFLCASPSIVTRISSMCCLKATRVNIIKHKTDLRCRRRITLEICTRRGCDSLKRMIHSHHAPIVNDSFCYDYLIAVVLLNQVLQKTIVGSYLLENKVIFIIPAQCHSRLAASESAFVVLCIIICALRVSGSQLRTFFRRFIAAHWRSALNMSSLVFYLGNCPANGCELSVYSHALLGIERYSVKSSMIDDIKGSMKTPKTPTGRKARRWTCF